MNKIIIKRKKKWGGGGVWKFWCSITCKYSSSLGCLKQSRLVACFLKTNIVLFCFILLTFFCYCFYVSSNVYPNLPQRERGGESPDFDFTNPWFALLIYTTLMNIFFFLSVSCLWPWSQHWLWWHTPNYDQQGHHFPPGQLYVICWGM